MKQLDGRLGINGIVIADNGAEVVAIDDNTVDVELLPPGIAANLAGLPALDPAVAGHRIVVRMRGIHEVNAVFRLLRFLKLTVLFDEGALPPASLRSKAISPPLR